MTRTLESSRLPGKKKISGTAPAKSSPACLCDQPRFDWPTSFSLDLTSRSLSVTTVKCADPTVLVQDPRDAVQARQGSELGDHDQGNRRGTYPRRPMRWLDHGTTSRGPPVLLFSSDVRSPVASLVGLDSECRTRTVLRTPRLTSKHHHFLSKTSRQKYTRRNLRRRGEKDAGKREKRSRCVRCAAAPSTRRSMRP